MAKYDPDKCKGCIMDGACIYQEDDDVENCDMGD